MSMPQPIWVALVGSSAEAVRAASKHFRLSAPGIGAALLTTLDGRGEGKIEALSDLPPEKVTLWVAIDQVAFEACVAFNRQDKQSEKYGRGYYESVFSDPCILIDQNQPEKAFHEALGALEARIVKAWYASS